MSQWPERVAVVISLVALAVSIVALIDQRRNASRQLSFPLVLDFIEEFRSSDFKRLLELAKTPQTRVRQAGDHSHEVLQKHYQEQIRPVLAYFNNVGVLVAQGTIRADLIFSLMGASALRVWEAQHPFIVARREMRRAGAHDSMLYAHYENLVVVLRQTEGTNLRHRLRLRRDVSASCRRVA